MKSLEVTTRLAGRLTEVLSTLRAEAVLAVFDENTVAAKRRLTVVRAAQREVTSAVNRLRQLETIEASEAPRERREEEILADLIVEAAGVLDQSEPLMHVADLLRDGKVVDASIAASQLPGGQCDMIPQKPWEFLFCEALQAQKEERHGA